MVKRSRNLANTTTSTSANEETVGQSEPTVQATPSTVEQEAREANENVEAEDDLEGDERPGKKKKSSVWDHYGKVQINPTTGKHTAKCNYCPKEILCHHKQGTSGLRRHLQTCPKNPNKANKKNQSLFTTQIGSSNTVTSHVFSQERCRRGVAKYIILEERPFRTVESVGFRAMMSDVEPRFKVPSRSTITRDCYKLYLEEAVKLKKHFETTKVRVSFTTDTWTSNQNANYMCLTAHWIDESWTYQKRILNFCVVENHKGETIADEIEKCLLSWGIDKVFTFTVDNASSNDSALSRLKSVFKHWNGGLVCDGDFMHLRCCAHILNLIVCDGVKDMHESVEAIRNAIKYVRSSPSRFRKFKSLVEKMKVESKGLLSLDCPTRWNSTYIMLESAIQFSSVFERMASDDDYKKHFSDKGLVGPPTDESFQQASEFTKFLKLFYNVTLKLSGSLFVTSHLAFRQVSNLASILNKASTNHGSSLYAMANSMKAKYDKYWDRFKNFNPLLVIAVVLDPRYKMKFLRYAFDAMYPDDPDSCVDIIQKVSNVLYRLFDHYSSHLGTSGIVIESQSQAQEGTDSSCSAVTNAKKDTFDIDTEESEAERRFRADNQNEGQSDKYAELDKYLQSDLVEGRDPDFLILNWWKIYGSKYKVLSMMARDVLAVPVSTVSSESAFSTGGRVIDSYRSSLSPKMVEALICAQNWLSPSTLLPTGLESLETDNFNDTEEVLVALIAEEQRPNP